jgi:copper chaperone NosL
MAGLWDFYCWEYDYGHNLNPHAPIQMAGMNYQPPLIGPKTLLNITAISLPDVAGIALGAVALIALLPLLYPLISRRRSLSAGAIAATLTVLVVGGSAISGCTPAGPAAIHVGADACDSCRMTITDGKFGGEVLLTKGKALKFDSIDCLSSYVRNNPSGIRTIYVEDFFEPGHLIEAENAAFARYEGTRGPMGSGWVAAGDSARLRQLVGDHGSEVLRWKDVKAGS